VASGAVGVLARCQVCGYVFLPRTADLPRQIADLYAGDYFTGAEFGDYAGQRPTFARNFRHYLSRMRQAGASHGRLLEVGCAYGFFLEQAQSRFDAVGIDVNAGSDRRGRRAVYAGDVRRVPRLRAARSVRRRVHGTRSNTC
jgi:hypothetical protein